MAKRLSDLFPGSKHVADLGLDSESDRRVCGFALRDGFVIVTQDDDFAELAFLLEQSPKVIWLTLGNASTAHREKVLRIQHEQIEAFGVDPLRKLLIID